jgi:hypothetical protein
MDRFRVTERPDHPGEGESLSSHRQQLLHREQHRVRRLDASADMARYLSEDLGFLFSVVLANADRLEPALPATHRHLVTELRAACHSGAPRCGPCSAGASIS